MLQTLHLHLLGDFRLDYGESPVTSVNSARLQSLLAYLVLHRNAPQLRQHLAFLLYPDSSEPQARTNLRYLLHTLRKALPDADRFLYADAQTLQWRADAPLTLDVADFEKAVTEANSAASLREAVNLYRGDLLPSCYDDWILPERERLRQRFIEALERLILLLENQLDYRSAINYAERLLRQDPLREETYRHLMRLHALSGDRAGALRVYQTCVMVLKRELDAEMSAATREAYEQLVKMEMPPVHFDLPSKPRLNNLPLQLTSFIGRERAIADLKRLLSLRAAAVPSTRLLTLTGAGGCGKTRLAIQVATELLGGDDSTNRLYKDGMWLVELAPLSDPALVPLAVAAVLGVREQQGHALMDSLLDYLQSKELLLILDDCEHLLATCAQFVEASLRACPNLRILASSSERLNVAGETVWLVPPLALPASEHFTSPAELNRSEAVRLFVERAVSALPTFALNKQNAAAVAQVCHHLDGIPLAIELAAARVKVLTVEQIAERLDDRFQLLVGSDRTALPKHQTLRAAMDWSYQLLSETDQSLFGRLSVFAGPFKLEAVEHICGGEGVDKEKLLDLLAGLVDKSLVVVEHQDTVARFRLLETVREYASAKLIESGESAQVRDRHLEFFLNLAEEAEPKLQGAEQLMWLNRLERQNDNLRAALAWGSASKDRVGASLQFAGALWRFWWLRGHLSEGRDWLARVLFQAKGSSYLAERAKALNASGRLAYYQGDYAIAQTMYEQSLVISREHGDNSGIASSINDLGGVAFSYGDYAAARKLYEESLAIRQQLGDKWDIALALSNLGLVAQAEGDYQLASSLQNESLRRFRGLGDKWRIAYSLNNLGDLSRFQGNYSAARELQGESLAIFRELGDRWGIAYVLTSLGDISRRETNYTNALSFYTESLRMFQQITDKFGIIYVLEAFAVVAARLERYQRAARLFGAVHALREPLGSRRPPSEYAEYERTLATVRNHLDEETLAAAWLEGQAMKMEQAIEYALTADNE